MSLVWTSERPTEPGWYLARFLTEHSYMVSISGSAPYLRVTSIRTLENDVSTQINFTGFTEWAGPIQEPAGGQARHR
jgi:hypothetical protein